MSPGLKEGLAVMVASATSVLVGAGGGGNVDVEFDEDDGDEDGDDESENDVEEACKDKPGDAAVLDENGAVMNNAWTEWRARRRRKMGGDGFIFVIEIEYRIPREMEIG